MSFFCLWIPQFPAWAMAQGDPDLLKRRFAISENGTIISASPLAEKHGVRVGMPAQSARLWCNSLRILPRDLAREAAVWEEVQSAVHDLAPRLEALEPGLLLAEVEASRMSRLVHLWGAHGGQAIDRATAHLAALVAERREIRCVRRGREDNFVSRIPLDFLLDSGLTQKSLDQLHKYGYRSVGDAWDLTQKQLQELLRPEAKLLFEFSRGPYHEPNIQRVKKWTLPQEITAEQALDMPALESKDWEEVLDMLLARACSQLGARSTRRLQIIAQTATTSVTARRFLNQPVRRSRQLQQVAHAALNEALESVQPLAPVVTGLEVRLGAFEGIPSSPLPSTDAPKLKPSQVRPSRWLHALQHLRSSATRSSDHFSPSGNLCHQFKPTPEAALAGGLVAANSTGVSTVQSCFHPSTAAPRTLSLTKLR